MRRHEAIVSCSILLALAGCSSEDGETGWPTRPASAAAPPSATATPTTAPPVDAPPAAASSSPSPAPVDEYAAEKAWAEAHGVKIEAGKVTVVAKRRGSDRRSDQYEDMFVVFRADATVARYIGTTKPAQMPNPGSAVVPDVDGNGRKDLGIVRPGVYVAHGDVTYGLPGYERHAFKIKTDDDDSYLPAWRDLDGDGVFSAQDKSLSEQRKYRISGIYIHYGFEDGGTKLGPDEYVGPWSVGCQNIRYGELDAFIKDVGGPDATFRYAIVAP